MSKKFWRWSDSVDSNNSELILEGPISEVSWWGDEVTPQEFRDELARHNGSLTVVLNSGGGDVFAGMAIYNALREYKDGVTIRVDGIAASIASVVAMAADKVIMAPGSMMMIHKPWTMVIGDTNDLDKTKEILQGIEDSIIPIYVSRSGLDEAEIRQMLEAETWMTAEDAVSKGFADEYIEPKHKVSISDAIKNALNSKELAISMSATKKTLTELVEKVKADETKETPEPKPEPAKPVVDKADALDKPAAESTVEPSDEVKETKSTEKETIMKDEVKDLEVKDSVQEIATDTVKPQAQATVIPTVDNSTYLKSFKALEDFASVLATGANPAEVKNQWGQHLTKMGITNPEVLLPAAVIQSIEDAFKEGGEIWNLVSKTGLDVYGAGWDTVTGEDSRAKGYNRDDNADKAEEVITLAERVLRPQFIYKYLTIPKEVVKEQRSTGALLQYVLSELPRRIVREVERAIMIGDGRAAGSDYKITSFVAVKADAAADNVFATQYVPAGAEGNYESLVRARALVKAEGGKYLVAKSDFVADTLLEQGVNGGYLFTPGTNVAQVFGFAGVITPDWMEEDTDNDAYIVAFNQYRTVGDNTIESFTNFQLKTNTNEYLQELWAGGGLTAMNSAVAIGQGASS